MKGTFSIVLLVLLCSLFFVGHARTQTNKEVRDDEYEVYSAFINQVYLSDFVVEWFTIRGDKAKTFDHITKVGQVVIFPHTMSEPSNGYFAFTDAPYKFEISQKLFDSFLTRNKKSYKLVDRFKVNVRHDVWIQTLEEAQAYSAEAERRKVSYDVLFLERFPKAVGTLMFYRIAFDKSRKKALVGVRQTDIYATKNVTNRRGGNQLALLSKVNKKWVVKRVFPGTDDIQVDLGRCEPMTKHTGLPLGSTTFTVIGKDGEICQFNESYEIEGGGATTECSIPSSLGKINIVSGALLANGIPFYYSKDLSEYCKEPKPHSLFDQFVPTKN